MRFISYHAVTLETPAPRGALAIGRELLAVTPLGILVEALRSDSRPSNRGRRPAGAHQPA